MPVQIMRTLKRLGKRSRHHETGVQEERRLGRSRWPPQHRRRCLGPQLRRSARQVRVVARRCIAAPSVAHPRPHPPPSSLARLSAWRRSFSNFLAALASFLERTCRSFSSFSFLRCSLVASFSAAFRLVCF